MSTKTVKVTDLSGPALDWAVAKCRGFDGLDDDKWLLRDGIADMPLSAYNPSTDWAQAGPIIEREGVCIAKVGRSADDAIAPHPDCWAAHIDGAYCKYSPTPLIAAMRCYVASKLGDEVEVPDELVK